MRREHVVIGGDDADIHRLACADRGLVLAACGKAVRQIAAGQLIAIGARFATALDQVEIGAPPLGAARDDALGHLGDYGV